MAPKYKRQLRFENTITFEIAFIRKRIGIDNEPKY
jgi:hypothetical protein